MNIRESSKSAYQNSGRIIADFLKKNDVNNHGGIHFCTLFVVSRMSISKKNISSAAFERSACIAKTS